MRATSRATGTPSWVATAILAAIGTITTDVVVDFIKRQPKTDDAIHAGMKFLLYLAQQPWLHIVGWIFVGLVAGLWLDLVLRKLDGSRANERKMLGAEMAIRPATIVSASGAPKHRIQRAPL